MLTFLNGDIDVCECIWLFINVLLLIGDLFVLFPDLFVLFPDLFNS